jgi:small subunit ribosomal protein S17
MADKKTQKEKAESKQSVAIMCSRGRVFEGTIVKKFATRVVVEFERTVYVPKYERFYKKKTRLHAQIPQKMEINVGDYVQLRECKPISKLIHFVVIGKIRSVEVHTVKEKEK